MKLHIFEEYPQSSMPVVAVDFDGTIVHNNYPLIENPNETLIRWIKSNRHKYIFILWTCREGEELLNALKWLYEDQHILFDYVNCNAPWMIRAYGDSRKIHADYYIDDRNASYEEL